MKTCESISRLKLLVDTGEAGEAERRLVESHLAGCLSCRTLEQEQTRLTTLVKAVSIPKPPRLDPRVLEAEARRRPALLRWPLLAAAALAMALAGGWLWVSEGAGGAAGVPRTALLDEWQFWLVSTVGHTADNVETPFLTDWNERDFARHLLVLEGLMPEEEYSAEEELQDVTSGVLPPISLQDCNSPSLLRS